jgi:amino acid permease
MQTMMGGPGLALRGPAGSMKDAVDKMRFERQFALYCFGVGVFFFFVSAITYAWLSYDIWWQASSVSVTICLFLGFFFYVWYRIVNRFKISQKEKVSGSFR